MKPLSSFLRPFKEVAERLSGQLDADIAEELRDATMNPVDLSGHYGTSMIVSLTADELGYGRFG